MEVASVAETEPTSTRAAYPVRYIPETALDERGASSSVKALIMAVPEIPTVASLHRRRPRRMDMAFPWVCLEWPWGSVRMRRARFSGARELGGSSPTRLGGLAGCQLTGPLAERPRMRIYVAPPHRTTKPSWGGDAQAGLKRIPFFS